MLKQTLAALVFTAAAATQVHAAPPAISPAKQELIQKVLALWQVDKLAVEMLQEPVVNAMGQARVVLQGRVPPDRQDAAMKNVAEDAQKFLEETTPVVKDRAQKLIPTTVVPMLAEKFTEDELRQIIVMLESPTKRKFEALVPEMKKTLGEKVAAETRPVVEPKLQDLKEKIGVRLRVAATP